MVTRRLSILPLLLLWSPLPQGVQTQKAEVELDVDGDVLDEFAYPQTCHAWTGASCDWEPNLKSMTVQYGSGVYNETFYAYVTPDVSTFYNLT